MAGILPAVDIKDAFDDTDVVYAVRDAGGSLHIVDAAAIVYDTDVIGKKAICGRKVDRLAHPQDGTQVCRDCERRYPSR